MEPSGAEVQSQTVSGREPNQSRSTQPVPAGLSASQSQYRNRFFSTPQINAGNPPSRGSLDNLLSAVSMRVRKLFICS